MTCVVHELEGGIGRHGERARWLGLFKPGRSEAEIWATAPDIHSATTLEYHAGALDLHQSGQWTFRTTNLLRGHTISSQVSFPTAVKFDDFSVTEPIIQASAKSQLANFRIHLTRGSDSYAEYPYEEGVVRENFHLPDYKGNLGVREYLADMNSETPRLELTSGNLRITVNFEEEGKEILGTWHGDISDAVLAIDLPLYANNKGEIAYGEPQATFSFEAEIYGIPDWFVSWKSLRNKMEDRIERLFRKRAVRATISEMLTAPVRQELARPGKSLRIYEVKVMSRAMVVGYYYR